MARSEIVLTLDVKKIMEDLRDEMRVIFEAGYNFGYDDGYGNGGCPSLHASTGVERTWSAFEAKLFS